MKSKTIEPIKESGFASVATLAKYYDVTRNTIWRWSKEGRLPKPEKISAQCTRWRWSDIHNHINRTSKES